MPIAFYRVIESAKSEASEIKLKEKRNIARNLNKNLSLKFKRIAEEMTFNFHNSPNLFQIAF